MNGHLFHAVGNCCTMCGVPLHVTEHPIRFNAVGDPRVVYCPGGPATNIRAISHRIAEARLRRQMQYDRPFKYPPA